MLDVVFSGIDSDAGGLLPLVSIPPFRSSEPRIFPVSSVPRMAQSLAGTPPKDASQPPLFASRFGLSTKQTGGHMARSIMLLELTDVFRSVPPDETTADYKRAIVEENALGKPTASSREKSFRRLVELYTLDPSVTLFRVLRHLAQDDPSSLPLVAATFAYCRDPQLRRSFAVIQSLKWSVTSSRPVEITFACSHECGSFGAAFSSVGRSANETRMLLRRRLSGLLKLMSPDADAAIPDDAVEWAARLAPHRPRRMSAAALGTATRIPMNWAFPNRAGCVLKIPLGLRHRHTEEWLQVRELWNS